MFNGGALGDTNDGRGDPFSERVPSSGLRPRRGCYVAAGR